MTDLAPFESSPARVPTGRLAPSPTGYLHLGHARSFLWAWWSARARGGRVVMRLEDLDQSRARPEFARAALEDLAWLGLDWDGPVLVQSDDLTPYRETLEQLVHRHRAYPCVCTRAELHAPMDAPHAGDREVCYPGTCRGRFRSQREAEAASGRAAGMRFAVPAGPRRLFDRLLGEGTADVSCEVGDFLLLRRDGLFSYQFAVVIDDQRQGVTEVVRGADLHSSAFRQAWLQEALGYPHPTWAHVPLLLDRGGRRLAKRDGDVSLASLRAKGVDPRALVSALAHSMGLGPKDAGLDAGQWLSHWKQEPTGGSPITVEDILKDLHPGAP